MTTRLLTYSPTTNARAADAVLRKAVADALANPMTAMRTLYTAAQAADLLLDRAVESEPRVFVLGGAA